MKKFIPIASTLIAMVTTICSYSQTANYATTKEKIYMQTNHVFFKPGETIYFKIYVVNAQDQKPALLSNIVYVDVISPAGTVVQKLTYHIENGYTSGSFDFDNGIPGGVYKFRAYTSWMQNENESTFFTKEITVQKLIAPRILMKLDFPEKGYGAGSEVKAEFSMRSLNDQPIRYYGGKFIVSIAGREIQTDNFITNKEGKATIHFPLPDDLSSKDGLLNVTVKYDSYTESISRSIPIVLNKIDLQFLPEGGTLLQGFQTNIAFKAVDENGKAADVKGEIFDSRGNKITSFESYHFGMGKFLFTPIKGEKYSAKISSPANISAIYLLPEAQASGVAMNITKEGEKIRIKLISTVQQQLRLVGQLRNKSFHDQNVLVQKGETIVELNERDFPIGIAQFTLYNANELPLSERMVFMNEDKNLRVQILFDKQRYQPREKVKLTLMSTDENNNPIAANFSISVFDDKLWTLADDKQDHILSWLLLSSELKGKIEEPQFYFKKDEPKAVPALDLLMLTQGYRYFDYIEYVKNEKRIKFKPDMDNMLSGMVVNSKGKAVKSNLVVVSMNKKQKALQLKTDDEGLFYISQLTPNVSYYLFAQSADKKEKVSIKILQSGIGYNPMNKGHGAGFNDDKFEAVVPVVFEQRRKDNFKADNEIFFKQKDAEMQEVVVVGLGIRRQAKELGFAIAKIDADQIIPGSNLATALNGKVAGLQVYNNQVLNVSPQVVLRGARSITGDNQALIILDGVPVPANAIADLDLNSIEAVTVIKGSQASALYGSEAANGAVVIESKKFRNEKLHFEFGNGYYYASQYVMINSPLYSVEKKFYAPKYHSIETEERTDFRETIYWNSVVQTDKSGKATVEFYNSDANTTLRAIAEGIGYNGKLGRGEATYTVQNAMSVDAKIPPYLTVGDKAMIPLVIKNNHSEDLEIAINVDAPKSLRVGDHAKSIILNPFATQQVLIPIEATEETNAKINFVVRNQFSTEKLVLPITASGKGFPVIETFSGNQSQQHTFRISKMVPGRIKANLKLFRSLEGQLLDGIESMLREPYGCFEQTSSTTYPNVYVLKYLRESGKTNPEIEKKALEYIKRGYDRLIGFETSEHGFEWFGRTPAHEALTAYGLLEFTDMKEFIKVDEQMLKRTKDFLINRRDGQGYFRLARNGLDQFNAVPDKIANIYIVYALCKAGVGKEIQLEYETAVKKALESNDGYQMSMMALAAIYMKNEKDYRALMTALGNILSKQELKSETSVVNSREASLRVETKSLYAMALMKETSPNIGMIAKLITNILSEKSYYGYGSTQATVLALEAIVGYSKLIGAISQNQHVDFTINGKHVTENKDIETALVDDKNSFIVHYQQDDKNIPYNLEVSYFTFTPPNSDKADLEISTTLNRKMVNVGETVRLEVKVTNRKNNGEPMSIAKIGIPAGLSLQPWQLKQLMEKNQVAYYELFDNYLVFYWMSFSPNESKTINLDLKAEIPGNYKGKASTTYLYYTPEFKQWNDGLEVEVLDEGRRQ